MGFDYLRDNMAIYASETGPARTCLRHRRRGRLHPDRRGAHAAHHLRHGRKVHGDVLPARKTLYAASARRSSPRATTRKRKTSTSTPTTSSTKRPRPRRSPPAASQKAEEYFGLENLSDPENATIAHHINQAIKAHGIDEARYRLRRQGRSRSSSSTSSPAV